MLNKKTLQGLVTGTFFVASTCGGAMAENLIRTGQWTYLADTVMGGISEEVLNLKIVDRIKL